jgi:hypothetical protein
MVAKHKLGPGMDLETLEAPAQATTNPEVSAAAIELFNRMQDPGFAAGAAKFMSMSPKEMGEAARQAAAASKTLR